MKTSQDYPILGINEKYLDLAEIREPRYIYSFYRNEIDVYKIYKEDANFWKYSYTIENADKFVIELLGYVPDDLMVPIVVSDEF